MQATLTTVGADLALVLGDDVREALRLQAGDVVDLSIEGDALVVRRASGDSVNRIVEAFQRLVEQPTAPAAAEESVPADARRPLK